jgi:hypothetical protein
MRTGLVGIAAAGGVAVLLVVGGVVLAARTCGPEPAPAPSATATASPNAAIGGEGMRARGTDELRLVGCEHAVVLDMAKLLGNPSRVREGEPHTVVTCDVGATAAAPGCERVAGTYFGAIGGMSTDVVGVRVMRAGTAAPLCSRKYAPNGADLGTF